MSYLNISGYYFTPIHQLDNVRAALKCAQEGLTLRGTILLAKEGVNLFLSGPEEDCSLIIDRLCSELNTTPAALQLKLSWSNEIAFNRFLVKIKKEIIAFDVDYSHEHAAPYISPKDLDLLLDQNSDEVILLDTRNRYETDMGSFKNAIIPPIDSFKEFKNIVESLKPYKNRKVITFCTGGIRCEKAATYLKELGFSDVYQLHGGILRYFEETPAQHYEGECFVFDKRVSLKKNLEMGDKHLCFACRHPLTSEELLSPAYQSGISCPYCIGASS